MIELIKILEGGIDLRTHQEEPAQVVLQNGSTTVNMPISPGQLNLILSLLGVQQKRPPPVAPAPDPPSTETLESGTGEVYSVPHDMTVRSTVNFVPSPFGDPGDDNPAPGEDYTDDTGAIAW